MKFYSFNYTLKVWLTSVLLAPLIYSAAQHFVGLQQPDDGDVLALYPIIVLLELILSFITWLVFWGITALCLRFLSSTRRQKQLLFAAGIILTINTFILIAFPENGFSISDIWFDLMLCNCLCIGAGSLIYKLKPKVTILI